MNDQKDIEKIDLFIRLNQNLLEVKDTSGIDVFAVKEKIDKLLDKRLELMKKEEVVKVEEKKQPIWMNGIRIHEGNIKINGEEAKRFIDVAQAGKDLNERLKDMREDIINTIGIDEEIINDLDKKARSKFNDLCKGLSSGLAEDRKSKMRVSERAMNLVVISLITMGILTWIFAAYGIWKWIGG